MDPAAVTPESFNIVNLFFQADWVVKLVMIGLAYAGRDTPEGPPRSSQVAFPGGAVRRRVHSVQQWSKQWCQLVESTYVAWAV